MLRNFLHLHRHYVRRAGMPGINKLTKELKDPEPIFDDPEGFGDLESDFFEVHKSHKQHEREIQVRREKVRHQIVGNKYFKVKEPNFLTYAEKEQIKLLYDRDANEWTPEKLSESFPATPETILQVIKAKWVASSQKRIENHDRAVIQNWERFREGELTELNPALEEHLRKFAARSPEVLKNLVTTLRPKPELPKPSRTEFSSIITESMKFRKPNHENISEETSGLRITASSNDSGNTKEHSGHSGNSTSKSPNQSNFPQVLLNEASIENETYLIDEVRNKKPIRFRDLVQQNPEIQQDRHEVAKHQMENPQGTGILPTNIAGTRNSSSVNKFVAKETEISMRDMISVNDRIRQRIHIPKKLWKKGYTYKLEDCYYDDDGEFLYRVPGMTGRISK